MASHENLPLPRAVQELREVESYVEKKELPREYVTTRDVSEGMSPFGPPVQYKEILDELYASGLLYESGIKYPGKINLEPAISFIRDRHKLPSEYGVAVGLAGSNELLERVLISLKKDILIFGIGPHFTGIQKSIKAINKSKYGPISPSLTMPLKDILETTRPSIYEKKPQVLYLAVPDARGDDVEPEELWDFTDDWCKSGVMVILDRALADFSSESNHTHPNMIEIRSYSKALGIPGDGFSYILGSNNYIETYKKHMKDFSYRGKAQFMVELLNRLSIPEIIYPHLDMVKQNTRDLKSKLITALDKYEVKYLPTSNNTPILIVDGQIENFFEFLDLPSTPGSGFFYTYDTDVNNSPITNRFVRIGLPLLDYSDANIDIDCEISLVAKRVKGAMNAGKQYQNYSKYATL